MKVEKNTATKPAKISPKMSSTNRFHSTADKLPDRRSFPQLRTDVDTQGEKHNWSLHRSLIELSLIPASILHRPFIDPSLIPSSTLHWSLHRSFIDPSQHVLNYFRTCWLHEGGEEHCNQTCKDQSKDEFNQPLSLNRSQVARQKEFSSTSNWRWHTRRETPLIPSSILHRPFIDPFIDPSSTLHRPFIDPFIDPSLIPSSILHRPFISPRPPFINPSSTLHWSLHRSFIDPSSAQDHPKTKTRPPIEKVSIFHQK